MSAPEATAGWRFTRDGHAWWVSSVALLFAALVSGNNLVYLVAAPVWAAGLVAIPLGHLHLRGLGVRRVLPAELFAGREAVGEILVRNGRARFAAADLEVIEAATGEVGHLGAVPAQVVRSTRLRYRFAERGRHRLGAVVLRSRWPMGLAVHTVVLASPAELVVFPRPLPGLAEPRTHSGPGDEDEEALRGTAEFVGLRPYRPGDPPRAIHWLSSARVGTAMVVERSADVGSSVRVVVADTRGAAWEQELSRATGEVSRAASRGHGVSLAIPGGPPELDGPPRSGAGWRRTLLEALALQPRHPQEGR